MDFIGLAILASFLGSATVSNPQIWLLAADFLSYIWFIVVLAVGLLYVFITYGAVRSGISVTWPRVISLIIVFVVAAVNTYARWGRPRIYVIPAGGIPMGIATVIALLLPLSLIWFGDDIARNQPGAIFPGNESAGFIYRFVGWLVLLLFAFLDVFLFSYH
jgi:hypothetical protein